MMHPRLTTALLMGLLTPGLLAETPTAAKPATLAELHEVQTRVQQALPLVRPALLALRTRTGAATGIIVSPEGIVLTAAHVVIDSDEKPVKQKRVTTIGSDGKVVMATTLGYDTATDAAMLQLDGKRTDWPFVPLKRSKRPEPGEWCFALGHPGGHDAARGDVLRVGKVLKVTPNGIQTDCVLMGGDSGGPLFALDGELIGIHSQIWEGRDQNVHVSLIPFLRSWEAMMRGEHVENWGLGAGGWLGVQTRLSQTQQLQVAEVALDSPASRAGLRSGDDILSLDGQPMTTAHQFSDALSSRAAGDLVVIVARNRSGERILTIRLGKRPQSE
jgi:serine protease Do